MRLTICLLAAGLYRSRPRREGTGSPRRRSVTYRRGRRDGTHTGWEPGGVLAATHHRAAIDSRVTDRDIPAAPPSAVGFCAHVRARGGPERHRPSARPARAQGQCVTGDVVSREGGPPFLGCCHAAGVRGDRTPSRTVSSWRDGRSNGRGPDRGAGPSRRLPYREDGCRDGK